MEQASAPLEHPQAPVVQPTATPVAAQPVAAQPVAPQPAAPVAPQTAATGCAGSVLILCASIS